MTKEHLEIDEATGQACWETVQRVAAGGVFHRAPRLRELLLYLADRSLHGSPTEITEPCIAAKVFGREKYNPAEDNLVRASVRQLRLKLKEYFETEGKGEPWIVDLPKGTYQVSFNQCQKTEKPPIPPPIRDAPSVNGFQPSPLLFAIVLAIAVCAVAAATLLAVRHPALQAVLNLKPTLMDLLVANQKQQTQVVVIDSALVLFQSFAGRDVSLEEYAGRSYVSDLNSTDKLLSGSSRRLLSSRQITSFSDVEIASEVSRKYGAIYPMRIRHARSMNVRDFKSDNNFLLIGSPLADPWAALFDGSLNFRFENHADAWPLIRNRHPRRGEEAIYGSLDGYDEAGPQYARIAVLHNSSGSGRVALIAGTSMEGTEAAGEAFLDPNFATSLARLFGVNKVKNMSDFEAVIQTEGVGGAGYGARVLATRKIGVP